jgi:RNase H-fold protein (predicted Holliday junction resolvase)
MPPTRSSSTSASTPSSDDVVLAIDPGRAKCGVAVVDRGATTRYRAIVSTEALADTVIELAARWRPVTLLLGNGTGAEELAARIGALSPDIPLVRVDERFTSEQARARYVQEVPARGWRRLLPRTLRYPETPYDDFVAVLLAERWWSSGGGEGERG